MTETKNSPAKKETLPEKVLGISLAVIALGAVAYHMISTQELLLSTTGHLSIHLFFILSLVMLGSLRTNTTLWPLVLLLFAAALASVYYMLTNRAELEFRYGFPETTDVFVGVLLIIAVLESCRRSMGMSIPILACLAILYGLFGYHLPAAVRSYQTGFTLLFYQLALDGIYGSLLSLSANYVFLFVVFGGTLQAAGISRLFEEIGILVGRASRSGPAMVAVVGSAIIGSVTMSPSANIAITGSYSIPLMKTAGYRPHQAAAIEGAASTGGQIMPPVMSSVAFIMSSITGIPYVRIIGAALIPAILYFISTGVYAHLQALKLGLKPLRGEVNWRELLLESRLLIVPIAVIAGLLVLRFTPTFTVFWAILSVIAMGLLRPGTRPSWRDWVKGFTSGATTGAQVGISLAALGVVVQIVSMTGLAQRLPGIVELFSGGNLILALGLIAAVTLVLGCGVPTPAAYLIVAMTTAPILIQNFHLSLLQAHYFVFYYAVIAMLTPPVAPAAFVASALAGAPFMQTALEQVKPAIAGFIIPLAFIWAPAILGEPKNLVLEVVLILCLTGAIILFQAAFVGYLTRAATVIERFLY
ncbi:MAG: TRAP transporter fused permease subunit, partial [Desulfobacterales bacterium]|nr:TRAP transporter fused permease subunit [Desulfobacterales bacterium]